MRRLFSSVLALALCAPIAASVVPRAQAQSLAPNLLGGLQWRLIGPFRGGRALAVTGVPGSPEKFYFGAVGGGVWESDNAGRTWNPIFDNVSVASIGAIAVAPSDPNTIYVGTGEADMRSDIQHGDGMYKSTDAGKTWTHIGLEDTRQIGKILVDPKDANTLYVAALGHQYGPNAQRGVFKSTDGGASWSKVLYKDANTGAIDLSMDPSDANVIYASLWQTRRPPWNVYPPSNGPGSGLYKTTDAGKTWTHITGNGFPSGTLGHIGISVSPANPQRVYTVVDTNNQKTGGVYRSDDAGANWTRVGDDRRVWTRGWYFGGITADPKNADVVYVMDTSTYRSTDGGKSFDAIKGAPGGDDYHTLWIEPDDSNRMILGSDQGVVVTVDGAKTWSSWNNQPTGQFYHVATDNRFPYWVYGAQQDSGAMALPSRSKRAGISMHDWEAIDVGGESGTIAPDPLHPGKLYGNPATYEDVDTGWEATIDPTITHPDEVWRSTWTLPVIVSPLDPHVVYFSRQKIFRTANGGKSWTVISPDLTRPTNTVPATLDAPTVADSTGIPRRGVVYWIAPSPVRAHHIWAGTDDGLIWVTRDEGQHWTNVTPPQLTPWSKVGIIDAGHFDAQTAYAAIDRHRLDDNHPYIYRTHDGGAHWTLVTNGIPADESVNVVREDPKRRGLLYAGTERSIYVSFDDGEHWQSLKRNLPAASVRDIVFNGDDVIVATHGRAFWILDDASPLRQMSAALAGSSAYLFRPATAYRTRPGSDEGTPLPLDEPSADNPPDGAVIDYYLGNATTPVVLEIVDASGRVARRYASSDKPPVVDAKALDIPTYWVHPQQPPSAEPGAHRYLWDLHYGASTGRRRRGGGSAWASPGHYTVRMTVNGRTFTQPLVVARDPRYPATDADLRAQFDFTRAIEDASAQIPAATQRARTLLAKYKSNAAVSARLYAILGEPPAGSPDDSVGRPAQDFSSLRYLAQQFGGLDGAVQSADVRPTADEHTAFTILRGKLQNALRQLDAIESNK